MKRMDNHKKSALRRSLPFLTVLGLVTVVAWILPLRPDISLREKRELEKFPEFSFSALADGSFFAGIDRWFSDTFPGRDMWIDAAQSVEGLYGHSDIVIYGDIPATQAVTTSAPEPTPEADAVTSAPAAEEPPAEDTAPSETPEPEYVWGGETISEDELVSLGAVIQIGDSAYTYTSFSPYFSERYAAVVSRAAELLDGKCRVADVLVLHGTTLLLPRDYRESIGCVCEEEVLDYVNLCLSDAVYKVDTYTPLLHHNGEYIYYRTDHHWTALGAYYAYTDWAKKMGFEPVPLSEYEENMQSPFYGSLYYKANRAKALTPDEVYTYTPPGDVHLFVEMENYDTLEYRGAEYTLLQEIRGNDKYMAFLTGDRPLCTLINNDITDGSACLLIKNSNGNPFAYYLTQHYQYVYVIDYRKYTHRDLSEFVEYYDVNDVIFCMSTGQAQSEGGCGLLEKFVQ